MNKKLITLLATLFAGFLGNVKADTFYPSSVANPTSTSTSYCQGASSVAPISTTMTAASCTTATASVTVTYTWYSSSSAVVTTVGATVVASGTVSVTSLTPPAIPDYTPVVTAVGTKHYFCQLSWVLTGCAAAGTIVPSSSIAITVNSLPTISSSPSNSPVCAGSDLSLSCNPTGGASPYSFSWTGPNSFNSALQDPTRTSVTTADAGTYSVSVTDNNGCMTAVSPSATIVVVVNSLPTISSSPSNSPVCAGSDLSLSCNPTGGASPYSFSWTGPNSFASMVQDPTRTSVTSADAGTYSVTVTDQNGCTTAASPSATIPVVVNSIATGAASLGVCKGGTISLTGSATGTWVPTFTWKDPTGTTISSTSSASISSAAIGDAGSYTLTATSGGCTVTGTTMVVVNSIAAAGAPTAVCTGSSLVLTGTVIGTAGWPTTYTWTGPHIVATTGQIITLNNIVALNAGIYTLTAVNGGCTVSASTATIVVNTTPTVTATSDTAVCNETLVTIPSFTSTPTGATFAWSGSNSSYGLSSTSGSGDITGFTASNSGLDSVIETFTVTPTLAGCQGASDVFNIIFRPTPLVIHHVDTAVCNNDHLTIVLSGSDTSITNFYWTNRVPASLSISNTSPHDTIFAVGINASSGYDSSEVVITPKIGSCIGSSDSFKVRVYNAVHPAVTALSNVFACDSSSVSLAFTGDFGDATYHWTSTQNNFGLASAGIGNIGFTAINAGVDTLMDTVEIIAHIGSCVSTAPTSVILTINPYPTVNHLTDALLTTPQCYNESISALSFTGTNTAGLTTYTWTHSGAVLGMAASGVNTIPTFTLSNTGTSDSILTVVTTASIGTCMGQTITDNILVHPQPLVNPVASSGYCTGVATNTINFTGSTSSPATTYYWSFSDTNYAHPSTLSDTGTSAGTLTFASTNATSADAIFTLSVTPMIAGCPNGNTVSTVDTIHALPEVNAVTNTSICNGATVSSIVFTTTNSNTDNNVHYFWQSSGPSCGLSSTTGWDSVSSFTATEAMGATGTTTINVTPYVGLCQNGSNTTFQFTVHPQPMITNLINQLHCNNDNVAIPMFVDYVTEGTVNYAWTTDSQNIFRSFQQSYFATGGSGNTIIPFTATDSNTRQFVTNFTITGTSIYGCVSSPQTLSISVNPVPQINAVPSIFISTGLTTTADTFRGATPNTSYFWSNSNTTLGLTADTATVDSIFAPLTASNGTSSLDSMVITVTPQIGTCQGPSTHFTINVYPTPTIQVGDILAADSLCNLHTTYTFSVTASPAADSFRWVCSDTTLFTDVTTVGSGLLSLATAGTSSQGLFSFTTITNTGTTYLVSTFTFTPVNPGSETGTPIVKTIFVAPTVSFSPIPGQHICNDSLSTSIDLTNNFYHVGYGPYKYLWQFVHDIPVAGGASGTVPALTFSNTTDSVIVDSMQLLASPLILSGPDLSGCPYGPVTIVSYTVNPTPKLNLHPMYNVCNDAPVTDTFSSPTKGSPLAYTWGRTNNLNLVPSSNSQSGTTSNDILSISETIHNGSTVDQGLVYLFTITATAPNNGCIGYGSITTDSVYPTPHLSSILSDTICNNSEHNYLLRDSVAGVSYKYSRQAVPGIATPVMGWIIDSNSSEILYNDTNRSVLVTYDDSVFYKGCGYHYQNTTLVRPYARLTDTLATICSEGLLSFPFDNYSSVIEPTKHRWNVVLDSLSAWNIDVPVLNGSDSVHTNITSNYQHLQRVVTITDDMSIFLNSPTGVDSNFCTSVDSVKVTINPRPHVPQITLPIADTLIFKGMTSQFYTDGFAQSDTSMLRYNWTTSTNDNISFQSTSLPLNKNAIINFPDIGYVTIYDSAYFNGYNSCGRVTDTTVDVTNPTPSIDQPSVILFEDDSTMVCWDNTVSSYLWGYDSISTLKSTIITDINGTPENNQDLIFNGNLRNSRNDTIRLGDTTSIYFWVQTTQKIGVKIYTQKSYYIGATRSSHKGQTGNNGITQDIALKTFPNPASNAIIFDLADTASGNRNYDVFDVTGNKVLSFTTDINIVNIPLDGLPAGEYLVICGRNGQTIAHSKFVKL